MSPNDKRAAWKRELQRTGRCIPIERLAENLTPEEHSHVAHCARCQAELALWSRINDEEETLGEAAAVASIAAAVRGRVAGTAPSNVVSLRRRSNVVAFRAPLAAAATLVIAIAAGVFVTNREPSIEGAPSVVNVYRSASVDVIEPTGDLASAPSLLRWKTAAGATRYDVRVMEVDRTVLWRGSTTSSQVQLPAPVIAQFVPGKTVLWQVQARRGEAVLAESGMQRFRVSATR
jgi:hypothetical protein